MHTWLVLDALEQGVQGPVEEEVGLISQFKMAQELLAKVVRGGQVEYRDTPILAGYLTGLRPKELSKHPEKGVSVLSCHISSS